MIKIFIDMQGAQTPFSMHRGVGRSTMGLVKALVRDPRNHDFYLALNGAFQEAIDLIRGEFEGLLPNDKIRVWQQSYDCSAMNPNLAAAKWAAEVSREVFLNNLHPDVIFSTNLQEGLFDPAPTSVKILPSRSIYCTMLHDVTPLMYPDRYLASPEIRKWYLEKIEGVRNSDIILTVSENSKKEIVNLAGVPADRVTVIYNAIDHKKFKPIDISHSKRNTLLDYLGISHPFILYAGGCDIHKNLDRLYRAFAKLPSDLKRGHQLVMVGKELHSEQHIHRSILKKLGINNRVVFTGYIEDDALISLYNLCTLFVFPSIHEGFGLPPLEAMACGAPVIASRASCLPEILGLDEALFNPYDEFDIAQKIERALGDLKFREMLKSHGIEHSTSFSWDHSAGTLLDLFDIVDNNQIKYKLSFTDGDISDPIQSVIKGIITNPIAIQIKQQEMIAIAFSLSETYPRIINRARKLFLDVSAVVETGDRSGIQRVVRAICYELVRECKRIDVEPVYTNIYDHEFYQAVSLVDSILGKTTDTKEKTHIEFCPGDILLYLDLHPGVAISHIPKTCYLRNKGVMVFHVIYDLLPAQYPKYFWPDLCSQFIEWLKAVSHADGVMCISHTVAIEFQKWYDANIPKRKRPFKIGWFHLGADIESSIPCLGIPEGGYEMIDKLVSASSFLVVGTLEPRKGHMQILDAFEQLWAEAANINLVIVGKKGWGMQKFTDRLKSHPQYGRRLFWLEEISDEYLEKIYSSCTCLISASFGEGFGLPLIEAAQHKMPIIARDIPVFREVTGDHAFYFKGNEPESLKDAVSQWLELNQQGRAPKSDNMPWLTWKQSAERLIEAILV